MLVFHVFENVSGFPFICGFGEYDVYEAQDAGFIRKEAGDAGATFEFFVAAFERVSGSELTLVAP